jgi:hypothetical protein
MVPYVSRAYLSVFLPCLIKMDFLKYVMKVEFHGYQRKAIHRLKWFLRVFMGLGSLSLPYDKSSSFAFQDMLCY